MIEAGVIEAVALDGVKPKVRRPVRCLNSPGSQAVGVLAFLEGLVVGKDKAAEVHRGRSKEKLVVQDPSTPRLVNLLQQTTTKGAGKML